MSDFEAIDKAIHLIKSVKIKRTIVYTALSSTFQSLKHQTLYLETEGFWVGIEKAFQQIYNILDK